MKDVDKNLRTSGANMTGDRSTESAEPKFTPGPWRVQFSGWTNGAYTGGHIESVADTHGTYIRDSGGNVHLMPGQNKTICSHYLTGPHISVAEGQANAHLVAAAPDMYAALEQIRNRSAALGDDDLRECKRQMAHIEAISTACLKQARGEQ